MIDAEFTVRVTKNLNLHSVRKFLRSIQVYIDSDTIFYYKHHFICYFRGLLSFLKFHFFGRKKSFAIAKSYYTYSVGMVLNPI